MMGPTGPKSGKPNLPSVVKEGSYEDTFGLYEIASHEPLESLKRSKCKKCGGSRMYFCYKCHVYVEGVDEDKVPKLSLPWKIDIIKHAKEVDGKSTAIHAALLAPDDVKIYTYPTIPDYSKETRVLLVFPGKKASTMQEIFGTRDQKAGMKRPAIETNGEPVIKEPRIANAVDLEMKSHLSGDDSGSSTHKNFDKIVFIDCTWSQAYGIFTDERINHLPTVKLNDHTTVYWRHNEEMPFTFLATIEAIYSFLKVSHQLCHGDYDGRFDNLLYYYSYFFKLVKRGIIEKGKVRSKSKTLPKDEK